MMAIAGGSNVQHPSSPNAVDETDDGDEETVDLRGLMASHPHLFVDASNHRRARCPGAGGGADRAGFSALHYAYSA
jgi:hypothetical protein